ncbi:MAG: AAA family ATPase [Butyrivibrio sp.]|nr:AAA family ATPase [Butyrivibrio sp.]
MTGSFDFDNLIGDVAKDFFGSNSDEYKDLLMTDNLKELSEEIGRINGMAPENQSEAEIKSKIDALGKLDEAMLNSAEKKKNEALAGTDDNEKQEEQEQESQKEKEPEKSGMEELNELIGLDNIKDDVKELVSFVKVQKMRADMGKKTVPISLHLVFNGNPGTGKTTIARILAKLYKEIGVLSKGQLVEVDRSGLVAGYVGQTATKTQEKIQEAMGGVLFIDEAYTLAKEGSDYGQEAIDTILKAMEDHRDDFIVIVAGYTEPMEKFISSNPGLKSRFNKYIEFPDYSAEELIQIFEMRCNKYEYIMSEEAQGALKDILTYKVEHKDDNFANAREARNLFEAIVTNQASRVAQIESPTEEQMNTIEVDDMKDFMIKAE